MSEGSQPPGGGRLDDAIAFRPLRVAVLTVSDTRDEESDTSGKLLADRVTRDGHVLAARCMVKDDVTEIRNQVKSWIENPQVDVVISTGGTGLTGRDVTPEAMQPLFDKAIEGFETVWHMTSFQTVGLSTMQSRACAGLAKSTLIFALPGSNGACKDGWDRLIRWQLDSRHRPCNLAELIVRFTEK
ncbi:MAG TPA: molybdenum cofactor biosynthesis protein B [Rhizomicrobium sp.]|nr:molybdenum cofactor biosynthesis protein B [Rhizomicrobium sp.]